MNLFNPNSALWIWSLVSLALTGLGIVTLIKFIIVLFKADKAIDKVRDYIKRRG